MRAYLATLVLLTACGSAEPPTPDAGPVPVSDEPLKGTVGGASFEGKYAVAFKDGFDPDSKSIRVAANPLDCSYSLDQDQYLLLAPKWVAGNAYSFSLQQNLTFSYKQDGQIKNDMSLTGRVEVIQAPVAKDSKGRIRIRAATSKDSVEGGVDVLICE